MQVAGFFLVAITDAGDTTAIDARLHGIRLFVTTNATGAWSRRLAPFLSTQ